VFAPDLAFFFHLISPHYSTLRYPNQQQPNITHLSTTTTTMQNTAEDISNQASGHKANISK